MSLERKSRKDIGIRRRNIFIRKNSEAAFKSVSGFNPEMEVMDSIIGHSVANALTPAQQQKHHQRVLCLDGGGMKVKRSLLFILKKKRIWLRGVSRYQIPTKNLVTKKLCIGNLIILLLIINAGSDSD